MIAKSDFVTTDSMTDRMPPHSKDAERGVLGGILRDPEALDDARQLLSISDFYFDAHQKVFRILSELADESLPLDMVVVLDRLRKADWLEDVGGPAFIADLWDAVQTGANVHYHAQIVRSTALFRNVIHASTEILRDAYDRICPAEELISQAEQKLFSLTERDQASEPLTASQLSKEGLERIDSRRERTGPDGLATGFEDLDAYLNGMKPGNLIVVGARPSCGKSAFSLAIALNLSQAKIPVHFASLEMSRAEITDRIFAMRSRVPMTHIIRGRIPSADTDRVIRSAYLFADEPFFLDDRSNLTPSRLASTVRRAIRRRGVRFLVVDYLQLLTPENPKDQRYMQVGMMALRMKQLARSCNIPVLLLSQLNRESEGRPGGRPKLSDLRESGDIEAHADVVLLLHPQVDPATKKSNGTTDVIIEKNRNGPKGEITLTYTTTITKFENAPKG